MTAPDDMRGALLPAAREAGVVSGTAAPASHSRSARRRPRRARRNIQRVLDAAGQGMTAPQIARATGLSRAYVREIAARHGLSLPHGNRRGVYSLDDIRAALAEPGATTRGVAAKLQIDRGTLLFICRKHGIVTAKPAPAKPAPAPKRAHDIEALQRALAAPGATVRAVAAAFGISRAAVYYLGGRHGLALPIARPGAAGPQDGKRHHYDLDALRAALAAPRATVTSVAAAHGLSRRTLYNLAAKHGLTLPVRCRQRLFEQTLAGGRGAVTPVELAALHVRAMPLLEAGQPLPAVAAALEASVPVLVAALRQECPAWSSHLVAAAFRAAALAGKPAPSTTQLAAVLGTRHESSVRFMVARAQDLGLIVVERGARWRVVAAPDGSWRTAPQPAQMAAPRPKPAPIRRAPAVKAPQPKLARRKGKPVATRVAPAAAPARPARYVEFESGRRVRVFAPSGLPVEQQMAAVEQRQASKRDAALAALRERGADPLRIAARVGLPAHEVFRLQGELRGAGRAA